MKKLLLLLCLSASLAGCKDKNENKREDTNLAKQNYEMEKNAVKVDVLRLRDFNKQLISNGKLEARRKSSLAFHSSGLIEKVYVSNGSRVGKGSVLAQQNREDSRIALSKAQIAFRKAEIDLADKLIDFDYSISDTASVPRETMEIIYIRSGYLEAKHNLETARMNYEDGILRAPFAGKVADVKSKDFENGSGVFCTLIDDAVLNVNFSVLETELSFVREGQVVKVHPFNNPQTVLAGRITGINPTVDASGQVAVTAQVANNGELVDGMNVKVIAENVLHDQMVVPKDAVVIRDNEEVIFRYRNGRSLWTYVNVLMANSEEYVIEANTVRGAEISVGDTVIVSGNMNLGGDTSVEIVK